MSSAGIQKLFCGIYSAFKCSFDEFVGEKVVSLSYIHPPSSVQYSQCEKAQSKHEEELSLDNVVQAPRLISA